MMPIITHRRTAAHTPTITNILCLLIGFFAGFFSGSSTGPFVLCCLGIVMVWVADTVLVLLNSGSSKSWVTSSVTVCILISPESAIPFIMTFETLTGILGLSDLGSGRVSFVILTIASIGVVPVSIL